MFDNDYKDEEEFNYADDPIGPRPIDRDLYQQEEKRSRLSYFIVALVAAIIGGLVSQLLAPYVFKDRNIAPSGEREEIVINTNDDLNTVSAVAKGNMSSVVGITTVELQPYFFMMREVEGVGSGVIIDSDGYILTNSHVVGDGQAKSLEVLFEDGEKLPGEVLWNNRHLDLAIVKVDQKGLPAAKLGDSDELEVGELAVAIGNPLGLEFQRSVTAGVISGLNRSIKVENVVIDDLIQTDASINRGNSGGPLLNKKGEVIGINTVKVSTAEGLGFSIPINQIKPIIEEVIKTGTYERVTLGIRASNSEEFARTFGVDMGENNGVVVIQVEEGSPAEKAGIKILDLITHIDGKEIKDIESFKERQIFNYKRGDKARLSIIRENEELEIEVEF